MKYILVLYLAAVITAGYGAFTDLKSHKIYNKLTMPVIASGLLLNIILGGIHGLGDSLLGLFLGFSFLFLWLLGMLKAGDVKLYMAVGALAGWRFCGYTMIYSILLGGAAALGLMVRRKSGCASLYRVKIYLSNLIYSRQFRRYEPEESSGYFSFGCCIFAGTLFAVWKLYFK